MQFPAAGHFPLIGGVVVDADDVQVTLGAAELGRGAAGDHVPRLELRRPVGWRRVRVCQGRERGGTLWISGSGYTIRASRVHRPDRVHAGDRGAHELALQLRHRGRGRREHEAACRGPGEERDLVYGRVEARARPCGRAGPRAASRANRAKRSTNWRGEDIHVVGPAVVAEIPDHLDALRGAPRRASGIQDSQRYSPPRSIRCQRTPSRAVAMPSSRSSR